MKSSLIQLALWGVAVGATSFGASAAYRTAPVSDVDGVPVVPSVALPTPDPRSLIEASANIERNNPFRFTRAPSTVREDGPVAEAELLEGGTEAVPSVPGDWLPRLSGIVGPPWAGVFEGVPGTVGPFFAGVGDSVGVALIVDITADQVQFSLPDTVLVLTPRRRHP